MRFEETRLGSDVRHQRYVRAIKASTALACACGMCVLPNLVPAESWPTTPEQRWEMIITDVD